jgi:hypothetical protein
MYVAPVPFMPDVVLDFDAGVSVMEMEDRLSIQQKALEALQDSTRSLEIAEQLLKVGNVTEAQRLRDEAREQRNLSVWLMSQSRNVDSENRPRFKHPFRRGRLSGH